MFVNHRYVTIEWGDCDPAGIVFYPRYFSMFDWSTAALFEAALGYTKREMLSRFDIAGIPIIDTGARFSVPSRFGDRVVIESVVNRLGRSSFDVSHRLLRSNVLAIEAYEKRVWVGRDPKDPEKLKSRPIPQEVIDSLRQVRVQTQENSK